MTTTIAPRTAMPLGLSDIDPSSLRVPRCQLMQATSKMEHSQPGKWFLTLIDEVMEAVPCRILRVVTSRMLMPPKGQPLGRPICFSADMIAPHERAQSPQSDYCQSCRHAKRSNGKLPACGETFVALAVRESDHVPFWSFWRSSAYTIFSRFIAGFLLKTHSSVPLYQASVTLSSEKRSGESGVYYVPVVRWTHTENNPEIEHLYEQYSGLNPYGDTEETEGD